MVEKHDFQILMKMTSQDFKGLSTVPDELAVQFFEMLEIEDK